MGLHQSNTCKVGVRGGGKKLLEQGKNLAVEEFFSKKFKILKQNFEKTIKNYFSLFWLEKRNRLSIWFCEIALYKSFREDIFAFWRNGAPFRNLPSKIISEIRNGAPFRKKAPIK